MSTVEEIRAKYRERKFATTQVLRSNFALKAFLRTMYGWRKDLPEKERKEISAKVDTLVKHPSGAWEALIIAQTDACEPFEKIRKDSEKHLVRLAKSLPVWSEFGKDVFGFGPLSLAIIVAEAGDLSNYSDVGKLNKRLGLAVIDGIRQGGLKKGSKAEDWIEHGYNVQRRAAIWQAIALPMLMHVKRKPDLPYIKLYLERKEFELARDPEMTEAHANSRARRYMEKRLLKDLWKAWRRDQNGCVERSQCRFPDAEIAVAV